MQFEVHEKLDNVPDLQAIWDKASRSSQFHGGGYPDYLELASQAHIKLRLVILRPANCEPIVAPFFLSVRKKPFSIGERRLFRLDVITQTLYSQWLMQNASELQIKEVFRILEGYSDFDWIDLGEIPIRSPIHRASAQLGWRWIVSERDRKSSSRWLIDLPNKFETYLQRLTPESRQSTKRKIRKLESRYDVKFKVVNSRENIESFLREGEKISRKTYQWNVGQRLCNDQGTRSRYATLCGRGQLRCYLLSVDGQPCAFLRGTVENSMFYYETPGFDPAFRKDSVGTVLLMYAIRDIIENTSCRVFDFGIGGDEAGYKSTYGTRSIPCTYLELGRRTCIYSNVIAGMQFLLNKTKNRADFFLGQGGFRQRVKRAIRRYGDRSP